MRVARLLLIMTVAVGSAAALAILAESTRLQYDPDRMDFQKFEQLVETPISRARDGDLDGARRSFAALLARAHARHGHDSVEAADLLMGMAVMLAFTGEDRLAAAYAARAVPAYRAAFGADHPEVALALTSYADIVRDATRDDPPAAAEEAMAEAYRIRLLALGPAHPETLWTSIYLAEIRAAPGRVRRDPSLVTAVTGELERAAARAVREDRARAGEVPAMLHSRRARLLAAHDRPLEARRAERAARAAELGIEPSILCLALSDIQAQAELAFDAAREEPLPYAIDDRGFAGCIDRPALRWPFHKLTAIARSRRS